VRKGEGKMLEINKSWAMPSGETFTILPIKDLIKRYVPKNGIVIDAFANKATIREIMNCKYISNDLDVDMPTDYHLEAQDFLSIFQDNSVDLVLYDPPYSGRQVSELYKKLEKTITMQDTNSGYYTKFKDQIKRVLKPNGIVISFGWQSNGIGGNNGFEQIEILLVSHGGNHNDTIVTVERKLYHQDSFDFEQLVIASQDGAEGK